MHPIACAAHAVVVRPSQGGAGDFALALSAMVATGAIPKPHLGEAKPGDPPIAAGQVFAGTGKDLPEIGLDLTGDEENTETHDGADPDSPDADDVAFAWFAMPAPPVAETAPAGLATVAARVVADEAPAIDLPVPHTGETGEAPAAEPPAEGAPIADARADADLSKPPAATADTVVPEYALRGRLGPREMRAAAEAGAAPNTAASATAPPPAPASAPVQRAEAHLAAPQPAEPSPRQPARDAVPPTITTAATLMAQALAPPAAQPISSPLRRALGEQADQPMVTSIAAPSAAMLQQVSATPDAQQGALDMRRQEWMGQMIDRIETMRDSAPVRETRIALMPDALGKVDISVRQDGDRVHVHFAAESQAARQILTDAQPRLAELAEARGVRLGQTSVDSGQSNAQSGQQRQDGAHRPQDPSTPASALGQSAIHSDERIA